MSAEQIAVERQKTLILENCSDVEPLFKQVVKHQFPNSDIGCLCNLPILDPRLILKHVEGADNIAIMTQASNAAQIDSFINMFFALNSTKRVYIQTTSDGKARIQSHPKFKQLQHSITIKSF